MTSNKWTVPISLAAIGLSVAGKLYFYFITNISLILEYCATQRHIPKSKHKMWFNIMI